ncbi:MAG: TonB-dependent receptor plug domain-containing protein, partial [Sphingobacterium sp.]
MVKQYLFNARVACVVLLTYFSWISPATTFAQNTTGELITGTVKDQDNNPIENVTVRVIDPTQATQTDANGVFTIQASSQQELQFSKLGFATLRYPLLGKNNITVTLLMDDAEIEEVIVVGAAIKKRDLTGAVVSLDESSLKERPVSNINDALQGKAAGVFIQANPQPGGDATIKIRGNNSMQYGGSPIYVVDGIVMESDFNMVNLNDITSVNVLKDASSTALYGSRGAQGVVVITTKRGKNGQDLISYDGWVGFQQFTNTDLT